MNVFLIHPDPARSASLFLAADPIRARKQLLECCQILASVDHTLLGYTGMRKANGDYYKAAHPHHPITKLCADVQAMYSLTLDVTLELARALPDHACSRSLKEWDPMLSWENDPRLICCRAGSPPLIVHSREEYAKVMLEYLITRKWTTK